MTIWRVGGGEWNTMCQCGAPAIQKLCAVAYCAPCADKILKQIRARVAKRQGLGFGEQTGQLRHDWGDDWADLECNVCGATWVGPIGEPCSWCAESLEHMRQWQTKILLRPELPDPDDERYPQAVVAWMQRLERGVEAELVTEPQILAAIRRAQP